MNAIKPSIPYVKNLDGLRALAVLLVLLDHWAPWKELHNILEFGRIGLLLFFMLSGYLITSVLLGLKERVDNRTLPPHMALIIFYLHRCLRIFPIYFLAIAIAAIIITGVRHDLFYHLFFLQNLSALFYINQPIYSFAMHLWSLGVEEQFYFLWAPVVLIFFNPKQMIKICISAVLFAILYKTYCVTENLSGWTLRLNTIGNIDSLAIGCLMALDMKFSLVNWNTANSYRIKKLLFYSTPLIFIVLVISNHLVGFEEARNNQSYSIFHDTLIQIPLWLLLNYGIRGSEDKYLSNELVVWVGKRSYGIYIWHQFVSYGAIIIAAKLFHYQLAERYSLLSFLIFITLTFFVAASSWKYIEIPFLKYKALIDTYLPFRRLKNNY